MVKSLCPSDSMNWSSNQVTGFQAMQSALLSYQMEIAFPQFGRLSLTAALSMFNISVLNQSISTLVLGWSVLLHTEVAHYEKK